MKNIKTVIHEMKSMSPEQLFGTVEELRRELFQLRLKSVTSHVKSYSSDQYKLKKAIARGLTFMNQKSNR